MNGPEKPPRKSFVKFRFMSGQTPTPRPYQLIDGLMLVLFFAAYIYQTGSLEDAKPSVHGWLRYLVAILPVIPAAWWMWSIVDPRRRRVRENDEFLRMIWMRVALASLVVTLLVVLTWSFLSWYAGVSPMPPVMILAVFMLTNLPAQLFAQWKYR